MNYVSKLVLINFIFLSGCSHDHYSSPLGNEAMKSDLIYCQKQAFDAYYNDKTTGILVGGAIGGVVGGIIGGSISSNDMQTKDIQPLIDKCMKAKGYNKDEI